MSATHQYFPLFGLPVSFEVDQDELTRRYRELQKSVHPDRYAHAGEREKMLAMSEAARINDAYQTLRDPVKRARYLLELSGGKWQDEQTIADPEFLMAQMELREELEEASETDDLDALEALADRIAKQQQQQEKILAREFSEVDQLHLVNGKREIQKLMFYRKLREETERAISAVMDQL